MGRMMHQAYYEWWHDPDLGFWYFELIGGNGESQCTGGGYVSKFNCLRGIEDHRANAVSAKVREAVLD